MLIQKYTDRWVAQFELLKQALDQALTGLEYHIEHVGSTSVPGLDAKPIIDIDIVYTESSEFEKVKSGLIAVGYYHNGNQGIEEREVFKRKAQQEYGVLDQIVHHLYVCPSHSQALERHILFRDYLRKHNWAKTGYQEMKYDLAEKANQDKKTYAALKESNLNELIDSIIEKEKNN